MYDHNLVKIIAPYAGRRYSANLPEMRKITVEGPAGNTGQLAHVHDRYPISALSAEQLPHVD